MKVCVPLVPPAVVTVTVRAPKANGDHIDHKLAISDVALITVTLVTLTSPPTTATVVASTIKLVPVSVTATVVPRKPSFGETLVNVGAGGRVIVKVCPPLVPSGRRDCHSPGT